MVFRCLSALVPSDLVRFMFVSCLFVQLLGIHWQRSVKAIKSLRRGKRPGREPDWRFMGPCSGSQLETCGSGLDLIKGLFHLVRPRCLKPAMFWVQISSYVNQKGTAEGKEVAGSRRV